MKKNNTVMFSWMNPALVVKKTTKYGKAILPTLVKGKKIYKKHTGVGYGVFAKKKIYVGDILVVMGGYILDISDENKLTGIVADKPIEISENFSIGPRKPSDIPKMPQHYINHSCNPNAGFDGQIFLIAMKNIVSGEEITYDYGMIMQSNPESNGKFLFECLCGSKFCRKTIAEDDWMIPDLQRRYNGFFQYTIQKKINSNKN